MSGNLVELAQRFVRLSGELDATRDAMKRMLLNGAGETPKIPFIKPARKAGGAKPPHSHIAAAEAEETILQLVRSSPGLRTAAIMKRMAAQRSTTNERLKRLQAKGLLARDGEGAGWRAPA